MSVKIELKYGSEIAFATMPESPSVVIWSGNEDLIEDAEFTLDFSYGAVGHNYVSGVETTALDLATALVHSYGQENVNVLEGVNILEKEEKEVKEIEKKGVT